MSTTTDSYYRARYYDPNIGAFISEDPIRFMAGINFYPYTGSNPINMTDPLGTDAGVLTWVWGGVTAGAKTGSTVLSKLGGTAVTVVIYLFDPSAGNTAQFANSAEAQYEQAQTQAQQRAKPIPLPPPQTKCKDKSCEDHRTACMLTSMADLLVISTVIVGAKNATRDVFGTAGIGLPVYREREAVSAATIGISSNSQCRAYETFFAISPKQHAGCILST